MPCPTESDWFVYLIRTRYDSLYCGITNHLIRRFDQHQQGKGARALRGKGPLHMEWFQVVESKSDALRLEAFIKRKPKMYKEALVAEQHGVDLVNVLNNNKK